MLDIDGFFTNFSLPNSPHLFSDHTDVPFAQRVCGISRAAEECGQHGVVARTVSFVFVHIVITDAPRVAATGTKWSKWVKEKDIRILAGGARARDEIGVKRRKIK